MSLIEAVYDTRAASAVASPGTPGSRFTYETARFPRQSSDGPTMIDVQDLRKHYGDLVAVDGISFTAEAGQIFGLLGPNGAGKTTTIGCMSGLLKPTSGRITVMGHDVVREERASRQHLGVVPQELALYLDLSAADNLFYWGAAYGMPRELLKRRVSEVLELIGLADRARDRVSHF